MNLHLDNSFNNLISLSSKHFNIPASAIRKDYFITMILNNLANSKFNDCVVFKGGTSLSKCYANSIERFSEDIDLTYIPDNDMSKKQISKELKTIETTLANNFKIKKINTERNDRNKSSFIWYSDTHKSDEMIKLEIGSSVKPEPYSKKSLKLYIQEYLEIFNFTDDISNFELNTVYLNVLNIERTFIDKVMSIKRHAICLTLPNKVRHIYDIVKLYNMPEIQDFISDKNELKELIKITKETDTFYLEKRNISKAYNPNEKYSFENWKHYFDNNIKTNYENLHNTLLFTEQKQDFKTAINIIQEISDILKDINE